ncbi:MAG TPA: AI-2E family transporter [Methanoregula sp.]|nr:AI-2E family transporter [Methanoregula sp.]
MLKLRSHDLFPIAVIGIIVLIAFVVFWEVMDMVLLGGSLAIVLMPLHRRLTARTGAFVSASLITALLFSAFTAVALLTAQVLHANAGTLSGMFSTIGTWLNDPATSPVSYGVPFGKTTLANMLNTGNALFVNYEQTLIENLSLYLFKIFVFFFSLGAFIYHGEWAKNHFMSRMPPAVSEWITRLSAVTVDTLYVIYVVQVAIAVLTFFIALPVFYLLGYGNVLFYSFLTAFCEMIPVLGSSATFLLIGAYALALGDTRGVFVVFFLGYLIVACLPEITVRPVLVGRRVKINAVIMFIGIIGGILTMGLAGFVLGPVMIVLLITSFRIYADGRKERVKVSPAPDLMDQ